MFPPRFPNRLLLVPGCPPVDPLVAALPKLKLGVPVEAPKRPPEAGAVVVGAWPEAALEAGWPKLKFILTRVAYCAMVWCFSALIWRSMLVWRMAVEPLRLRNAETQ